MAVIEKKIWPQFFNQILKKERTVDLRLADFDLKEGDFLLLKEWDPVTRKFTGRQIEKKVKQFWKAQLTDYYSIEQVKDHGMYLIKFD